MGRSRKLWVWLGAGLVVLGLGTAVALTLTHRDDHHAATTTTTTVAPPFTSAGARTLSTELATGTDAALRHAVAVPDAQPLDPTAAAQLRKLTPITFTVGTFHATDSTHATIQGRVAKPLVGESHRWSFTLIHTGGVWKIVDAEPTR